MIPTVPTNERDTESAGSFRRIYIWIVASAGALGGLIFGYDWVVIGGAKPFYERYFQLNSALGSAGTFWIFPTICVAGLLFLYFSLPETRGRTLEGIERSLRIGRQ